MKETIAEIKRWLEAKERLTEEELARLQDDPRVGVRKLAARYMREQNRHQKEQARLEKMWHYEKQFRQRGLSLIAGIDEAGRGPLAGPVVAAAVMLPEQFQAEGLNDSKQLTAEERQRLRDRIEAEAIAIGIGMVDASEIDRCNILQATFQAMRIAVSQLDPAPEIVLVDAVTIPNLSVPQQGIIKGDSLSHSIAAASVIAKTTRDEWMAEIAKKYPVYGFERNMGYGTSEHLKALYEYGPSPVHRRSFAPVRSALEEQGEQLSLLGEKT
ncbi:ribonuclease HII [Thermoactinomyces mirandus]|uniref:Ribonuclease HII n=1 Tax=Thermoactinomyces mirandus TaxID=2756294 RepID=A0A7W1XSU2_9BACL|nr:ribonuclease HII [Thermoactinomyces mirandus]MBA4602440.1 ribonuclease HII [Thermoactinomyces mirandus]